MAAFVWLRWRLLVNSLRRSEDTASRMIRLGEIGVTLVLAVVFLPIALGVGALAFVGGRSLAAGDAPPDVILTSVRLSLAILTAVVVLAPLLRSLHGATTGRARFLLLPIARRTLHACEVAASLGDPWLLVIVPAVILLPLGMAVGGALLGAVVVGVAGCGVVAILATLSALAAFCTHLLFRNRRRAEVVSAILVVLVMGISLLPALLDDDAAAARDRPAPTVAVPHTLETVARGLTWVIPSELYGRVLRQTARGRLASSLGGVAAGAGVGFVLFLTSSRIFGRVLAVPHTSSSRRHDSRRLRVRADRLPGLSAPVSAVAWSTVCTALRTARVKMDLVTNPAALALLYLMLSRRWEGVDLAGLSLGPAEAAVMLAVVLPLLAVGRVTLNCFAVDRAGLSLEFLAPLSDLDLIRGKMAGGSLLAGGSSLICLLVAAAMTRTGPSSLWLVVALGGIAAHLLLGPLFAILSTLLPRTADLSAFGRQGNPSFLANMAGMVLVSSLLSPTVILALAGRALFGSLLGGVVLTAAWAGAAALLSILLTQVAAGFLGKRREHLLRIARGR
ncbi:MAG: hypothetical protein ACE5IK_10725 [Acidobacteriota bacterium]